MNKFASIAAALILFAPTIAFAAAKSSATLTITVTRAPKINITCPPNMTVADDAPKGTVIGSCIIAMDDGSAITGASLAITSQSPAGIFALGPPTVNGKYDLMIDISGPGINQGPADDMVTLTAVR